MKYSKYYVGLNSTQKKEMAKKLGTSRQYLWMLNAGTRFPGLRMAFAIERISKGKVPAKSWL